MIGIRRRPPRAPGFLLVVAAWAITAVLGLAIVGKVSGASPTSTGSAQHASGTPGLGWNVNLYPLAPPGSGEAEKTTVAGARAAVGFPVRVPSEPVASSGNLTQAWVSTQERQLALVFNNGKVDILMHRATYQSDMRYFHAFVAQKSKNRVRAVIGQVNGRPALIITRNTDAFTHSNPAMVDFDLNGIDVRIYSNTYGTHTLLAIANSMQ